MVSRLVLPVLGLRQGRLGRDTALWSQQGPYKLQRVALTRYGFDSLSLRLNDPTLLQSIAKQLTALSLASLSIFQIENTVDYRDAIAKLFAVLKFEAFLHRIGKRERVPPLALAVRREPEYNLWRSLPQPVQGSK